MLYYRVFGPKEVAGSLTFLGLGAVLRFTMPFRSGRENEDPDRVRHLEFLRQEERRLAARVREEQIIVERLRAAKLALGLAIEKKLAPK